MRHKKYLVFLALAAGMALPGASTLSAQDIYRDRQYLRNNYADQAADHARVEHLRADLANDQYRLNEAVRCGRPWEAERIRADMARDQYALNAQYRDLHHDRYQAYRTRRDLARDYRYDWR